MSLLQFPLSPEYDMEWLVKNEMGPYFYLSQFLVPGGQIGIVVPGIVQ